MNTPDNNWKAYEDVAREVLHDLRHHLEISDVGGYRKLPGKHGNVWKVEGTAVRVSDGALLIIECRRHTTQGLTQESIGGLAYRVSNTMAGGAIVVTPLPLQSGAALIASGEKIAHVQLEPWSTTDDYLAKFMEKCFHKVTLRGSFSLSDAGSSILIRNGERVD